MNVYDWDGTIYKGDSTVDFVFYLYTHYPKTLCNLPRTLFYGLGYALKLTPNLKFKENLYHMFTYVKDIDKVTDEFTSSHLNHVKKWYLDSQKEDDVVISASPEFLISSFCEKVNIHTAMASRVEKTTGKYNGLNCHGEEKVKRFYERFPSGVIDEFYSDSLSDTPLAKISHKAYIVKNNDRTEWPL